jgi:hypothetical protein
MVEQNIILGALVKDLMVAAQCILHGEQAAAEALEEMVQTITEKMVVLEELDCKIQFLDLQYFMLVVEQVVDGIQQIFNQLEEMAAEVGVALGSNQIIQTHGSRGYQEQMV